MYVTIFIYYHLEPKWFQLMLINKVSRDLSYSWVPMSFIEIFENQNDSRKTKFNIRLHSYLKSPRKMTYWQLAIKKSSLHAIISGAWLQVGKLLIYRVIVLWNNTSTNLLFVLKWWRSSSTPGEWSGGTRKPLQVVASPVRTRASAAVVCSTLGRQVTV